MAEIPDDERYRRRWRDLSFSDRRRILGAVTGGRALDDPAEAALAVVTAERQERFWSRIWWISPVVALLFIGQGWEVYLINAVLATAALGGLSWWRLRRVRRAGRRNRAVAAGRDPDASRPRQHRGKGGRGHTPRKGEHSKPRRQGRPSPEGTARPRDSRRDKSGLPPDAKGVRPGAGEPKRSRRKRRGDED